MRPDNITTLAVFVTSDVPDVYVNILGYCVDHYSSLNRVVFLGVLEDRGQKDALQEKLNLLRQRVRDQLDALQNGAYLYQDKTTKEWKYRQIEIEPAHRRRYARIAMQAIDTQVLLYGELDQELARLASDRCVFDVSGVLKGLLVDIYVILAAQEVGEVRVFELQLSGRTYDERELIHNLSLDRRDYEYANLTRSPYTKELKILSLKDEDLRRLQFEQVEEIRRLEINRVIDAASETLARRWMLIYALLVAVVLFFILGFMWRKGWDELEPLTFILFGLVPYLVACVLASFGKKSLSFDPRDMLDAFRKFERSRLIESQRTDPELQRPMEQTVEQRRE